MLQVGLPVLFQRSSQCEDREGQKNLNIQNYVTGSRFYGNDRFRTEDQLPDSHREGALAVLPCLVTVQ